MSKRKIYIIAGEASGDQLGAKLINQLKKISNIEIEFFGVGGAAMMNNGFKSLFPIKDISIMGFLEIIPHIFKIYKRLKQTVSDILAINPDILITIDSPGFNYKVVKILRKKKVNFPIVHYVAPTVWAYKPERAKKTAILYDHLFLILPFEKKYFEAVSLDTTYIGHPIIEDIFRKKNDKSIKNLSNLENSICLMPGSRITEIKKIFPIFIEAINLLAKKNSKINVIIPAVKNLRKEITLLSKKINAKTIITFNEKEKIYALKNCKASLVKSGTSALEAALLGANLITAYKVNFLSYYFIKKMVKIKFVNLVNITLNKEVVPEFVQNNCTAKLIAQKLDTILEEKSKIDSEDIKKILKLYSNNEQIAPSLKAANKIIDIIKSSKIK